MAIVEGSCSSLEPYALRVLGDSMEPEFADGCVIIVDPGYVPHDGSYVVVEYVGDVFFRQLVVKGERRFLKPLNPKYGGFELTPPYKIRGGWCSGWGGAGRSGSTTSDAFAFRQQRSLTGKSSLAA